MTAVTFADAHSLAFFPVRDKIPQFSWSKSELLLRTCEDAIKWDKKKITCYGLPCLPNNLIAIDCDVDKTDPNHCPVGEMQLIKLLTDNQLLWTLEHSYHVRTPSGGSHYLFHGDASLIRNCAKVKALGSCIDIRAKGGYIMCPYSITKKGVYLPIGPDDESTFYKDIPQIPNALMDFLVSMVPANKDYDSGRGEPVAMEPIDINNGYAKKQFAKYINKIETATKGRRNDTLYRQAFAAYMLRQYINIEKITDNLIIAARHCGLNPAEYRPTIKSAYDDAICVPPAPLK